MKRNFTSRYSRAYNKTREITGHLPKDCRYQINYAKAKFYEWEDGSTLINQYYRRFLFYMELFEYQLKNELDMFFSIKQPALFLFLMLDGNIHFFTSDGTSFYDAKKGMCYATSNDTGDFRLVLPKGHHLFFYLQPKGDYLQGYPEDYPALAALLLSLEKDQKQYGHLPACLIEGDILNAMLNLYKLSDDKDYDLESEFIKYCRELLMAYHRTIRLRLEKPVYQIRDFMSSNYANHQITAISALARRFNFSVRTLEREYHREFDTSPQQYVRQLRMEKAQELILKHTTVREVADLLGYSEISSFSRAFKRYFGYSPNQTSNYFPPY